MAPSISLDISARLRESIDGATNGDDPKVPGALLHIVDSNSNVLFSHGAGNPTAPDAHTISIIQSLTKIVGATAYLQLVERGLVTLDDPNIISTHLPELANKKVLKGCTVNHDGKKNWEFEDRKVDITPRMLMNHTYGGGHTFFNTLLFEYFTDIGIFDTVNESIDTSSTVLASPLLWQPGTKANYGQGLDWLAILIERLTKQSLASYLQTNIFDPLSLTSTGFEPAFGGTVLEQPTNKGRFWPRALRTPTGLITIDAPEPERKVRDDVYPNGTYHSGCLGTGLVSSASDYARLVTIFLPQNNGVDPVTGHRLLSPESVREITSPSLPEHIRNNTRCVQSSNAAPIVSPADLQAANMDPEGSWGLGCGVQGAQRVLDIDGKAKKGRSKGSVYWYGATNCEFWVDGEKGVVVFMNGNFYPWMDKGWLEVVAQLEGLVYEGLVE
jgi:CubicO group peptidase (beta-lactamase class C family)